MIKCPECDKKFEIPDVVIANCERYDGTYYKLRHTCGKIVELRLARVAKFVSISKLYKQPKTDDWEDTCSFIFPII